MSSGFKVVIDDRAKVEVSMEVTTAPCARCDHRHTVVHETPEGRSSRCGRGGGLVAITSSLVKQCAEEKWFTPEVYDNG